MMYVLYTVMWAFVCYEFVCFLCKKIVLYPSLKCFYSVQTYLVYNVHIADGVLSRPSLNLLHSVGFSVGLSPNGATSSGLANRTLTQPNSVGNMSSLPSAPSPAATPTPSPDPSATHSSGRVTWRAYFVAPLSASYDFSMSAPVPLTLYIAPLPDCELKDVTVLKASGALPLTMLQGEVTYVEAITTGEHSVDSIRHRMTLEVRYSSQYFGFSDVLLNPLRPHLKPFLPDLNGMFIVQFEGQTSTALHLDSSAADVSLAITSFPSVSSVEVERHMDNCGLFSWDVAFSREDVVQRKAVPFQYLGVVQNLSLPTLIVHAVGQPPPAVWLSGQLTVRVAPPDKTSVTQAQYTTLSGLTMPGRVPHVFLFRSCNDYGCSSPTIVTLTEPPPPLSPVLVSATGGIIKMRAKKPTNTGGFDIVGFAVELLQDGSSEYVLVHRTVTSTSMFFEVGGLKYLSKYYVRVCVLTAFHAWSGGTGLYSVGTVVVTSNSSWPQKPSAVQLVSRTGGAITGESFLFPQSCESRYLLPLSQFLGEPLWTPVESRSPSSTFSLTMLKCRQTV